MNVSPNELNSMVNRLMRVGVGEAEIGLQCAGLDRRPRFDGGADFWGERLPPDVRNMHRLDAAGVILCPALDDAENCFLAHPASALDLPLALALVHILGETADERFVRLNPAAHF